jgi:hypothetical protein
MMSAAPAPAPDAAVPAAEEMVQVAVADAPASAADQQPPASDDSSATVQDAQTAAHELIVIDGGVADRDALIAAVRSSISADAELLVLDPTRDGVAQITDLLAERTDISALHIVSHGDDGALRLGTTWVRSSNLASLAPEFTQWGRSLTSQADILFYGCDLAATIDGQQLLTQIGVLTGADVAASSDLTGHRQLGGDWDLEFRYGLVETAELDNPALERWQHTLGTNVYGTGLIFGTERRSTSSGVAGLPSWQEGDVIQIGGPGLQFEPGGTSGAASLFARIGVQATGNLNIDGMDVVDRDIVVGGVQLRAGDLLVSAQNSAAVGGLSVKSDDVFVYRPSSAGDYSGGSFFMLFKGMKNLGGGRAIDVGDFDLIESSVQIGDVTLQAGDFVFTSSGGADATNIGLFRATRAGSSTTEGSVQTLIEGADLGISAEIDGLVVIEHDLPVGGETLASGDLLIATGGTTVVGSNSVTLDPHDVVRLSLTQTTLGSGQSQATAALLFDGSDLNLDSSDERIKGLELLTDTNESPTVSVIPDRQVTQDETLGPISFTIADDATAVSNLTISAASSDQTLIADSAIVLSGSGADRTITISPTTGLNGGPVTITLTVSDDTGGTTTSTFQVTINAPGVPTAQGDHYTVNEDGSLNTATSNWWDSNWSARRQLTFDNSARAENLTDFPVLVKLDASRIDYSRGQADGGDLRFVDRNGTVLAYEIETWNPAGESTVWVRVPQIDASSASDSIWMYYGNSAAADGSNAAAVWSSSYQAVYHMNGVADATGSYSGTNQGSTSAVGQVGNSRDLNGTSNSIQMPGSSDILNGLDQVTTSAWIKLDSVSGTQSIVSIGNAPVLFILLEAARLEFNVVNGNLSLDVRAEDLLTLSSASTNTAPIQAGQWTQVAAVADLTNDTVSFYVNGALIKTASVSFAPPDFATTDSLRSSIGADFSGGSQYLNGQIDELTIEGTARSQNWISASYASTSDALINYGAETYRGGVLDNDSDPEADNITAILVTGPSHAGAFQLNADGTFTYTPVGNYNGVDTFTYLASDGVHQSTPVTVTINVTAVNDVPQLVTNQVTITEGGRTTLTAADLSASDVDADDPILTFTVSNLSNAHFENVDGTTITSFNQYDVATGNVILVHDGGETAPSYDISVSDGVDATTTQAAAVTFTNVNDAPTFTTNTLAIAEGGIVILDGSILAAADPDSASSTFVYTVSNVAGGRFEFVAAAGVATTTFTQSQLSNGEVTFIHDGGESAPAYEVAVTDGFDAAAAQAATINFTSVNDAPVLAVNTGAAVNEGASVVITGSLLGATDADTTAGNLVYSITTAPSHGRVELTTAAGVSITSFTQQQIDAGLVRFVHDGGETTSDSFAFTLSDGLASATGSFALTVTPVNDAPQLGSPSLTIQEGQTVVLTSANFPISDADDASADLTIQISNLQQGQFEKSAASGVAVSSFTQAELLAGDIRFVHDGGELAPSFEASVSDGTATTSAVSAIVAFTNVNDAPTLVTNTGATVTEGGTVTISSGKLSSSDPDNTSSQRTYTVTSSPTNGRLERSSAPGAAITSFTQRDVNLGLVRYVHNDSETTTDSFDFSLSDGQASVTGTFAITVSAANDAPVLGNHNLTVTEGGTVILSAADLSATDAETAAGSLIFEVSNVTSGQFERTSAPGTAVTSFTQDEVLNGQIAFVHNGGESAPSFDVAVNDGTTTLTAQAATVSFTNINDAPTITANTGAAVAEAGTITINSSKLNSSDSDNSSSQRTYTITSSPTNGRLERSTAAGTAITSFTQAEINSGTIRYVHGGSETTTDSFAFTLSDGQASVTGTFALTISAVNDVPVLGAHSLAITEGGTVTLTTANLSATDAETAVGSLSFVVSNVANGRFERTMAPGVAVTSFTQNDVASGLIAFVHNGGESAPAFDVAVSDTAATSTAVAATITFTNVNDAPTITANTGVTVAEGGSTTISSSRLSSSDPDNGSSQRTYTVTSGLLNGRLERTTASGTAVTTFTQADINAGRLQYVHDGSETTSDSFQFTLTDGQATLTGTFAITVTPANDAPVLAAPTLTLSEGQTVTLSSADISAADSETAAGSLVFSITDLSNGRFERATAAGTAITSFTQAEITAGQIRFVHNGSNNAPAFKVSVSDGSTSTSAVAATVTFQVVNDAPVIDVNTGLTVAEGGTTSLTSSKLHAADDESSSSSLRFTLTSGPAHGRFESVFNPGAAITSFTQFQINFGWVRYVHDGSEATTDAASFTLSDGVNSVTGAINITVRPVDDAPTLGTPTVTITEGGTITLGSTNLPASDADTADASLTYMLSSISGGQFERSTGPGATITSFTRAELTAGAIRFVHNGGESAPTFDVSLTDGTYTVGPVAASVTFIAVDDAPVIAVNTGDTANEGGSILIRSTELSASDPDTSNSSLRYTVTANPLHGRLELTTAPGISIAGFTQSDINAGRLRYVHDGGESTADSFSFSLSDGTSTVAGAFAIAINPVNDLPQLAVPQLTITEGSTVLLTAADLSATDAETPAGSLTFTVASITHGQFELTTSPGVAVTSFTQADITAGRVRFLHDGGETAPTWTVSVSDGTAATTPVAADVTFTNVDDPPVVAVNTGGTVNEGSSFVVTQAHLAASDPDTAAGSLTYTLTTSPSHGRLELTTSPGSSITKFTQSQIDAGLVRYVHDGGESTADSFTFSLSDGTSSVTGAFAISVTPVNDVPVLGNHELTIAEGGSVILTTTNISGSDAETTAANLVYNLSTIRNGRFELTTNVGIAITSFTGAQLQAGQIRFVHDGGEQAPAFRVEVSDGIASSGRSRATIHFTNVNDAPTLGNATWTVNENSPTGTAVGTLTGSDPDAGDQLRYEIVSGNTGGAFTVDQTTGAVTVASSGALNFEARSSYALTVRVTDLSGATGDAVLTINLNDLNEAPTAVPATLTILEHSAVGAVVGQVQASDPDAGDQLTWEITADSSGGAYSIDSATGRINVADASRLDPFAAPTVLTVKVRDAAGLSSSVAVVITVQNVNDPPVVTTTDLSVAENSPPGTVVGVVQATDPDLGDQLSYAIIGGNSTGTFQIDAATGEITIANPTALSFETNPLFNLQVRVRDNLGLATIQQIAVHLLDVNETPTAATPPVLALQEDGTPVVRDLSPYFNDVDGDSLTYEIVSVGNSNLFSDLSIDSNGRLSVDTASNANGSTNVVIRATDAGGLSVTLTQQITIAAVNDAPIAAADAYTLDLVSVTSLTKNVLVNDSDVEGTPLTLQLVSTTQHGTLQIQPNGALIYTPRNGFTGTDAFRYQVTDGDQTSNVVTVTITVLPSASAPVIGGSSGTPTPTPTGSTTTPTTGGTTTPTGSTTTPTTPTTGGSGTTTPTHGPTIAPAPISAPQPDSPVTSRDQDDNTPTTWTSTVKTEAPREAPEPASRPIAAPTVSPLNRFFDAFGTDASANRTTTGMLFGQLGPLPSLSSQQIHEVLNSRPVVHELAEAEKQTTSLLNYRQLVSTSAAVTATTSFTIGYVIWTLRGGILLTSVIAQLPAWHVIDPLVVLDSLRGENDDGESLENIVEDGANKDEDTPEDA